MQALASSPTSSSASACSCCFICLSVCDLRARTLCFHTQFCSAYGSTAALAQAISRGITKAGVGVSTVNLELVALDKVEAALEGSDGFVIGESTLPGQQRVTLCVL